MTAREAGVVGSGSVGLSLAAALRECGGFSDVWVAGRRRERPDFLRGRDGIGYGTLDGWIGELPGHGADELLLFFCVPDGSIREAAEAWGRGLAEAGLTRCGGTAGDDDGGPVLRAAFHTSGSRPASVLEALAAGADRPPPAASLHPLCAVARPDPRAFEGVTFGVEGDRRAVEVAAEIAETLGRRALRVSPGRKPRYHAGAVLASNLLAACLGAGLRELRDATDGEATVEDVLPLARSALEQVDRQGLADGLTGPAVRGDLATLEGHLRGLDPAARSLYARLTTELLRQAEAPPSVRQAVERMIGRAGPEPDRDPDGGRAGRPPPSDA